MSPLYYSRPSYTFTPQAFALHLTLYTQHPIPSIFNPRPNARSIPSVGPINNVWHSSPLTPQNPRLQPCERRMWNGRSNYLTFARAFFCGSGGPRFGTIFCTRSFPVLCVCCMCVSYPMHACVYEGMVVRVHFPCLT